MRFPQTSLLLSTGTLVVAFLAVRAARDERPPPVASELAEGVELLDSRRVDYYEAHDAPRIVAEVALALEARGPGRAELFVRPSATGPFVDPPPGPRARRGSNEKTALEMACAVEGGRLAIVTRGTAHPRESSVGTVEILRSGRLGRRGLAIDGALERSPTQDVLPLELELASGDLPCGRWTSEVCLDGVARLAIDYEITADGGAILEVRLADPRTRLADPRMENEP